ncbi:hypothetical protein ES702_04198 [subsurface metagenome]
MLKRKEGKKLRLNEHDPLYPLENEEIKTRKKLKKDRRKRGFEKSKRKKKVKSQRNKRKRRSPLHTRIQERLS